MTSIPPGAPRPTKQQLIDSCNEIIRLAERMANQSLATLIIQQAIECKLILKRSKVK